MSKATDTVKQSGKVPWGLVLELEGTAVSVRQTVFDAVSVVLKKEKIACTPSLFMRHGLHSVPEYMARDLHAFLGLKDSTREALQSATMNALEERFAGKIDPMPGLQKLLASAAATGAKLAVVSWQSEEAAKALTEKIGLMQWRPLVLSYTNVHHEFPGADTFLKALKQLEATAHRSVALVSCAASSRAATAAGMRCAVVPDSFTSFQDFAGADWVADSWSDVEADQLFAD